MDSAHFDMEKMLSAFETMPYTKLDRSNEKEVEFAKILINDALGKLPPGEIDKYILPSDVIGFSPAFVDSAGFVFTAHTPEGEDDFLFLVDRDVFPAAENIDDVMAKLASKSAIVTRLVHQRFHTRYPYGLGAGNNVVASARISKED
ncbi:hypothetical protein [Leclercia adecarboxylata]|uniref:hypothetical protein n=1 Tax=Leclercia adecarboxylata TaxID=83655 RepID=UPI003017E916